MTRREFLILLVIFLVAGALFFKPWVHGADGMAYYSWLRSTVIDRNLNTTDEYVHFGFTEIVDKTSTGYQDNPWAVGSAILWSPFFLVVHAFARGDGYAAPYFVAISLASALYAFAALLLSYRLARSLFAADIALLAVIVIWFASPLVFYMYMHPSMSHANDAFVNTLFVTVWLTTRGKRRPWGWALLGGCIGLAALVRTQNGLLVLVPAFELISGLRSNHKRSLSNAVLFVAGLFLAFSPQMFTWWRVYGSPIVPNPYATTPGNTFNPLSSAFLNVLFSSNHGLFTWTPAILPAVVGLFFLSRRDRGLAMVLATIFLSQVWLVGGWSMWNGAAAFGQRFMVNNTVTYILGLAALLESLRRRIGLRVLSAAGAFFVLWNFGLLAQYITQIIPRQSAVSLTTIAANQTLVIGIVIEQADALLAARLGKWR